MRSTTRTIRSEKDHILKKRKEWYDKLVILQTICHHVDVEVKHKSDTGNYCKNDDRHWKENNCNDCGKFWIEEKE